MRITRTEIAARIGDAQYRLANGEESMNVEQDLLRLRDEIMATETSSDVVAGYRADTVEQVERLRELLAGFTPQATPDSELFHIAASAELVVQKSAHFFALRNRAAEKRLAEQAAEK